MNTPPSVTTSGGNGAAPGFPGGRRERILTHLEAFGYASNRELLALLRCSQSTLRRDLETLEAEGLLARKRGGAVAAAAIRTYEPTTAERMTSNLDEKRAIARYAAARFIDDEDVILLDSGSTALALAQELVTGRRPLTVVTNSIPAAAIMGAASHVKLIVTGGECRSRVQSLVGEWHRHALSGIRARTFFLGANAVSREGVTTPNLQEAEAKRAMVETAERVVLLADHSKLGHTTFASVCPLSAVHFLVTGDAAAEDRLEPLRDQGIEICLAPTRVVSAP
jgi:DeoR/GlpR family transcriptional regulator of sugar metabolism